MPIFAVDLTISCSKLSLPLKKSGENDYRFQRIFEDYYTELRAYACRLTGNADEAEDVVEDTFVDLWKNRGRLDFSGNIRSYLYRAVYSNAIDLLRSRGVSPMRISLLDHINEVRMEYVSAHNGQTHLEQQELATRLEQAIDSLPEKCRMVFRLSYINGLSNRDIALSMGISVRTVEAHIYKALHELRIKLRNVIWIFIFFVGTFSSLSKFFLTLTKYFS